MWLGRFYLAVVHDQFAAFTYLLTYFLILPAEHRYMENALHLVLFWASFSICLQASLPCPPHRSRMSYSCYCPKIICIEQETFDI